MIDKGYNMIFKRKSFMKFNDSLRIINGELNHINEKIKDLVPLIISTPYKRY